ncbi:MAG: hypothetical protein ABR899_04180 [Candidatus Krumholzibacteriaceae bacterium]|jgi:hypothetical protein
MKVLPLIRLGLLAAVAALAACSSNSDCPTCPKCKSPTLWAAYDSLNASSIDAALWYTEVSYGGRVLETAGELQVWGHTDLWTGYARARTKHTRLGWKFTLVEEAFQEGNGCQGWCIQAVDPANEASVVLLNHFTAGCTSPPNRSDIAGSYEIKPEQDSIAVYLNGTLLRRVYGNGIGPFVMQFSADNAYGDGSHCHVFIDNVWGLEYKP